MPKERLTPLPPDPIWLLRSLKTSPYLLFRAFSSASSVSWEGQGLISKCLNVKGRRPQWGWADRIFLPLPTLGVRLPEDSLASRCPGQWEEVTWRDGREEIQLLLHLLFLLSLRAGSKETVHRPSSVPVKYCGFQVWGQTGQPLPEPLGQGQAPQEPLQVHADMAPSAAEVPDIGIGLG